MPTSTAVQEKVPPRLVSLDALRGFDMFWIVGAEEIVNGLSHLGDSSALDVVSTQLTHVDWEGFHFEDLIFPMFVFIVGVSLVFSLSRIIAEKGKTGAVLRIVRRAAILYALGVFCYGGVANPDRIRLLGVLQRIALAYLFAGLIFVFFKLRGRIAWCVGLLAGYWALMTFVHVPGGTAGDFAEGKNLANWVDAHYLPLWKWEDKAYDPEGLLSTLPTIANCLLGVFAGMFLRDGKQRPWQKVLLLAAAGGLFVGLGWLWGLQFPVIKKIWTSSFVLVACGYSSMLLAAFYLVVDVLGWRRWAAPFVWVGMNPIAVFMLHNVVHVNQLAKRIVGGPVREYLLQIGPIRGTTYDCGPLAVAIVGLLITFGFAWFLFRRKIFLRL